jgi:hypothetical protein
MRAAEGPILWATPMSWERCRLLPRIAIWRNDCPTARSSAPPSSVATAVSVSKRALW